MTLNFESQLCSCQRMTRTAAAQSLVERVLVDGWMVEGLEQVAVRAFELGKSNSRLSLMNISLAHEADLDIPCKFAACEA